METSAKKTKYTFSFKLKVIQFAEQKGKHAAAKLFKIDRKRDKSAIENGQKSQKRLPGGGKPVRYKEIDNKLMAWFREKRDAGVRVTGKAMRAEASRLHKENGSQSFKASLGWFDKFKKRHKITFRRSTHVAQHSTSIVDDRVDKFFNFVIRMRRFRGYETSEIGNMDETPVWFQMPGKSTLAESGEKEVRVATTGHEKERLTVTLAAYADGTKLPPLVHLPGVRPLPKNEVPNGVVVFMCGSGKKSWANEESINFWLKRIWGLNNQKRRFLVWDAFRAHITPSIKESVRMKYNSDLCVIPGGCTSKLQPADVSWNKLFKSHLSEMYDEWLFSGPVEKTKGGNRRAPSKSLILKWIKQSWDAISPDIIRKSFKKCGISNALDGSEDNLFQNEGDDDPFEGFDEEDVRMDEEILANVSSFNEQNTEISDGENEINSELEEENESDYDSDGH